MPVPYNIYELSSGRVVVFAEEELGLFITWNESMTFQVWSESSPGQYMEETVFSLMEVPPDLTEARRHAHLWVQSYQKEMGV